MPNETHPPARSAWHIGNAGALPASWLAATLVNLATAATTIYSTPSPLTGISLIDIFIYGALLCNVAFFFYVEAYTECTPAYQEKLRAAFILEWYLRVLNQVLLSVLWILLAIGTGWFLLGFFAFYVILLVWDFIILVAENKSRGRVQIKGTIVIKDFQGLLVTAAFVLAMTFERLMRGDDWYWIPEPVRHRIASLNSVEAAHYFVAIAVGICVAAYATILVATCRALEGFNPLRILANRNRLA